MPAGSHVHVPWSRLLASRQVWMLCWQYFALSYGWYFYITWLPTYLREARGTTVTMGAMLAGLPLLLGGVHRFFYSSIPSDAATNQWSMS